jgi:SNF2 family DNA or RNA helicase
MAHKDYQYEGIRWCLKNELALNESALTNVSTNMKGGFIADEMGLGKTILMIGTFYAHFVPKTLVVVPLVLLDQWYNQILKTTGHKATVYHGQKRFGIHLNSVGCCFVLTTYDMIKKHRPTKKYKNGRENPLHSIQWDRVVFDEGHHLRNKNTQVYLGALSLKARIRWIVSGTPIQNKIKDFYNLCAIIGLPVSFYTNKDNLDAIALYYILKRTKKQVGIDIGDVSVNSDLVPWNDKNEFNLSKMIHSYLPFSNMTFQGQTSNIDLTYHLIVLLKARMCCVLPKLLFKKGEDESAGVSIGTSKMDSVVNKILERKDNGNGKLVFCHFREEIDEMVRRLVLGGMCNVQTFDGRVKINKRKEILGSMSNVLILQIQTGCEGLNLQENYNEIYFVSPHWNPAVEDQAVARCHRIGQKKQVEVFRFEMAPFLNEEEERMPTMSLDNYASEVQEGKRYIAREVFG